jgi:two-component system chemotaxis response regulator CheY
MPTVLVVDDDADTRELERMALELGGFNVRLAVNGADALELLGDVRPCVILLDLMMPVMDGLAFLEARRSRPEIADVPVICLSAAGPEMISDALRLGARGCLCKPTDFDKLYEMVRQHCDRSSTPQG